MLLDKDCAPDATVTQATAGWLRTELAAALPFVTPIFLPDELLRVPPLNWGTVARSCAGRRGRRGLD